MVDNLSPAQAESSLNPQETLCPSTHRYQPAQLEQFNQERVQQFKTSIQDLLPLGNQILHGIEVSQAIQNMNLTVPLIANKSTLVRTYLKFQLPLDVKVGGSLLVSWRANSQSPYTITRIVGSTDYLKLSASSTPSLREQREDLQKSLNFVLPDIVLQAGECRIQLLHLDVYLPLLGSSFRFPFFLPPSDITVKNVSLQDTPPLRLRVLGIRYQDNQGNSFEPSGTDYALIQSWLKRAYPISTLNWSQVVVAAPQVWPFDAGTINAFVRGIRMQDVANGTDGRTHYYGLVSDGAGFMRGLASGIPNSPDPSTVASGPTGPNWSWDTDGSYGDWYTGHELGHTFGRYHAEFCGAVGGSPYPFENGQLSNADEEFVGLDFGDASNNIARRALPGTIWHDVMTYCDNQWLSSFTYCGIRDRLVAENSLPFMALGITSMESERMSANGSIHILATVNLTKKTGTLRHVIASDKLIPNAPQTLPDGAPNLRLKLYSSDGQLLGEYLGNYYPDACLEQGSDETGIVDVVIPADPNASTVELLLSREVIDSFSQTATANAVRNIQLVTAPQEQSLMGRFNDLTLEWTDESRPLSFRGEAVGAGVSYIVQVSKDNGATWQTIGYDLAQTRLAIAPGLLDDTDQIQVRITSTDGFTSQTVTQTLSKNRS